MNIEADTDFDAAFASFAKDEAPAAAAAAGTEGDAAAQGASDGDGQGAADATAGGSGDTAVAGNDGTADAAAGGDAAGDVAAGEGGAAGAATAGDAAGSNGATTGAAADATAGPSADDILAGLKKLVGEAPKDDSKPAAQEQAAGGDQTAQQEAPIYSDDETAFLAEYDKEWGDVARGEALKRRAEYQTLLKHVFTQVAQFIQPIRETAELLAERTHVADITGAIPDYSDQLRDDVTKWVETQPAYLQAAYNQVITQGTVDEVKDLVARYREATGAKKPAGAGGSEKPKGRTNELSEPAKQAAAALAPVESKRSGVQAPSDPSNFDDAWKAASSDIV